MNCVVSYIQQRSLKPVVNLFYFNQSDIWTAEKVIREYCFLSSRLADLVTNISILCIISPTYNCHSRSQSVSSLFTISCFISAFQCNIMLLFLDFSVFVFISYFGRWELALLHSYPHPCSFSQWVLLYCNVLFTQICWHDFDYCLQLSHMYILW